MSATKDSPAVAVAKAHAEAWSNHDWNRTRRMLADEVQVDVTTTQPISKPVHTTGVDAYMEGLLQFAKGITPGSAKLLGAIGDEHTSLTLYSVRGTFAPGAPEMTLATARLAEIDDQKKIKAEQVVFFALQQ
jgi:hypothetical protein